MDNLDIFKINFRDNKEIYNTGDAVNGQLDIKFKNSMDVKSIQIKFCGKAHVGWTEHTGQHTMYYYNNEKLFNETKVVYGEGSGSGSSKSELQGNHSFPFTFQLPTQLPSTYKDSIGYVKYYVRGMVVRAMGNLKTKEYITVMLVLDLNKYGNSMTPSSGEKITNLCCFCCKSGPIKGNIQVDRSGYVSGDTITANATVQNKSSSKVKATSVELVRVISYRATLKTRTEIRCIVKSDGPPCKSDGTVNLSNVKLRVPPRLQPTDTSHCKIIEMKYAVMIHGHLRRCAFDLRGLAEVMIGTVPVGGQPDYSTNREHFETSVMPIGVTPPPAYENNAFTTDPKSGFHNWTGESAFSYGNTQR